MNPQWSFNEDETDLARRVKINAPALMLRDEGLLDVFIEHGFAPEIGLSAEALDDLTPEQWREMTGRLKDAGLRPNIHGPFLGLSVGAPDPYIRRVSRYRCRQAMDLAEIAGAEAIIYHPGYEHNHHRFYREQWIEYSRRTWRPLARRAARAGMGFVLENTFERGPADVLPLLEALAGEGVGFCLDTGHVTAFSQTPMEDWAAAMHPHITALHLHDNNGDQDQHLGLGQGAIDFASLLTYLADRGVKPRTVTLEPHQPEGLAPSFHVLRCIWPDSWR